MNTTFIFDTVLYTTDSKKYFARTLHYSLWKERYMKYFGKINVVTRSKTVTDEELKQNIMMQEVNGEGVSVNPINAYTDLKDLLFSKKTIDTALRKELLNSDFVIIRMPSVLGIMAEKICRINKISYLIELVADPWDSYRYHTHWAGSIVAPFMYFCTKKIVKRANNVLYVTKKFLQNRYPSNGENRVGVSDVIIIPESEKKIDDLIQQRIHNIKKKNITFGIVGNYDLKTKGQSVALIALKKFSLSTDYNFNLELVGTGNQDYLLDVIRKNRISYPVFFAGSKSSGLGMAEWMDSTDVLLVPSFQEGLPRVVVEAMSRGLIVIGSNAGGIPELLNDKMIFKKGSALELYYALLDTLNTNTNLEDEMKLNYDNSKKFKESSLNQLRIHFYEQAISAKNDA